MYLMTMCACSAQITLCVIISMGKINRNLEVSMKKATLRPSVLLETSMFLVQTGRTVFSSWRLPRKLNIAKNVIANSLMHAKKWP